MKGNTHTQKWQDLLIWLKNKDKIAIACSGGLDSRLLAFATKKAFENLPDKENHFKVLHISGVHIPSKEEEVLAEFTKEISIDFESYEFNPLEIEEVAKNSQKRCYFCKEAIFRFFLEKSEGYCLCDGTNIDDLSVYRPGLQALKELKISSPFVEVGITKEDIRTLAKELGLPFYNQPSQACLLTRFDYGISPNKEDLLWLDKKENALAAILDKLFRLRLVENNVWQLHVQADKNEFSEEDINEIQMIIPQAEIVFLTKLNAYFDSKAKLLA